MTVIYAKRQNIFGRAEDQYRVEDDALAWRRADGSETRHPWGDVTGLRASFAGTQLKPWRYIVVFSFRNGANLKIDNGHFAGVGNFENRSPAFRGFVQAAAAKILAARPEAELRIGEKSGLYWLEVIGVALVFALLAAVILLLPVDFTGGFYILRFLLIAAMLPLFFRWLVRARPRHAPLNEQTILAGLPPENSGI